MMLKPLAFAAAAAAFVIVPEISEADDKIFKALPVTAETDAFGLAPPPVAHKVSVPCPQCKGKDSHLELDFAVKDRTRLMLNDFELYPNADPWGGDLMAALVKANGDAKSKRLGYSLAVEPVAVDAYQQMELIDIQLNIIEVGRQFVEGVPTVNVQIIRALTDDIAIGNVQFLETGGARCDTMWCRAKDLAGEVFKALNTAKGCVMGSKHGAGHADADSQMAEPGRDAAGVVPIHGARPQHPAGDDDRQRHDWRLLLKNIASHIFLPVLMGVTAGVGVAVFAMVLCSVAIRLTKLVKSRRSQRSTCCRRKHAARQQDVEVEKVALMEEADGEQAPPQYQDDDEAKN